MTKPIGFIGYAGAGKNVIADTLGYPQYAFATALKDDLAPLLRRLGLDLRKREDKEKARELLVAYGRLARAINPDVWVQRLAAEIKRDGIDGPVVITDVRYLNEVLYILNHGGQVFWVHRPGVGPANEEERASFSEIREAWLNDKINYKLIVNDGTIEQAADRIRILLASPGDAVPVSNIEGVPGHFNGQPILYTPNLDKWPAGIPAYESGTFEPSVEHIVDAEAAVTAHPTMQKLQAYPDDFDVHDIPLTDDGPPAYRRVFIDEYEQFEAWRNAKRSEDDNFYPTVPTSGNKGEFTDTYVAITPSYYLADGPVDDCTIHSDEEFEACLAALSPEAQRADHRAREARQIKDKHIEQRLEAQAVEFDRCFKDPTCNGAPAGFYFERLPLGENGQGGVMTRVYHFFKWLMN